MKIRPLHDRLLNERIDEEARSRWGLIIPDTARENPVGGRSVIDPIKVVRAALQNDASVASLRLTTEALIAENPEKTAGGGDASMPDMAGMGM